MKTLSWGLVLFAAFGWLTAFAGDRDYLDWAGIREAWQVTQGEGVSIALLNTGINYHLPEFRGRILKDLEGNYGFDAVTGKFDPMDQLEFGLGTQVASIVAGNEFGLATQAQLVPVRVFDENGISSLEILAKGVDYAISRGVKILELWGWAAGPRAGHCALPLAPARFGAGNLAYFPSG